ncbi:hypothetical protein [Lelliottia nimipressuralis]|uniref:hypothetical protein n=1 Tax=Lelliottia nimipressuralis TaxID=69220 RepID=UPI003D2E3561
MLAVAFVAKGNAHARVSSSIDQQDIDYLRSIQNSKLVAAASRLMPLLTVRMRSPKTSTPRLRPGSDCL